jgi:hypothetical protein
VVAPISLSRFQASDEEFRGQKDDPSGEGARRSLQTGAATRQPMQGPDRAELGTGDVVAFVNLRYPAQALECPDLYLSAPTCLVRNADGCGVHRWAPTVLGEIFDSVDSCQGAMPRDPSSPHPSAACAFSSAFRFPSGPSPVPQQKLVASPFPERQDSDTIPLAQGRGGLYRPDLVMEIPCTIPARPVRRGARSWINHRTQECGRRVG